MPGPAVTASVGKKSGDDAGAASALEEPFLPGADAFRDEDSDWKRTAARASGKAARGAAAAGRLDGVVAEDDDAESEKDDDARIVRLSLLQGKLSTMSLILCA